MEGDIGRYRRRYLVPVPHVGSLAELNGRLAEDDIDDGRRHIEFRAATVADDFAAEQPALLPLPGDGFDTGTVLWPRADKFARISVGKCRYSVPARLIGSRVRIRLTANELEVFEESRLVAVHPRLVSSGAEHLDLDHYLEILLRKPGALPGSAPGASGGLTGLDAFLNLGDARCGLLDGCFRGGHFRLRGIQGSNLLVTLTQQFHDLVAKDVCPLHLIRYRLRDGALDRVPVDDRGQALANRP